MLKTALLTPIPHQMFEDILDTLTLTDPPADSRLDVFCAVRTGLSRSRIEKLIETDNVLVNGAVKKKNYKLSAFDVVTVVVPEPEDLKAIPQNIPLKVVYEDDDIIVVDKPAGMVVHPAPGNPDNTLVNALLWHCGNSLSGINGVARPGIVHRLDKDTSGIMICAKNDRAHIRISQDIKDHNYQKTYYALCWGSFSPAEGTVRLAVGRSRTDRKKMAAYPWDSPNAKNAVTHYFAETDYGRITKVRLLLETGRTHQIRVHMASIGHPVVGDPLYAAGRDSLGMTGQCLHSYSLEIDHPVTGKRMSFVSPLPGYFETVPGKIR